MNSQELRTRIDRFADDVITLCRTTASDQLALRLLTQLQDSGTSAASNYRAACRAQSKAAFIAKLSIALEEADESVGWLRCWPSIADCRLLIGRFIGRMQSAPLPQSRLRQCPILRSPDESPNWQSAIVNGR